MNARERIFAKVRAATEPLSKRAALPDVETVAAIRSRAAPDASDEDLILSRFKERWSQASGILADDESELIEKLRSFGATKGYVDPSLSLPSLGAAFEISGEFVRDQVDAYSFSVTRATGAIAETGTVILTDRDTPNRLSALAPWIHVAVVERQSVYPRLREAMGCFGSDPSVVMVTGPSKTADIESVLIEGVHGPGVQICMIV